MEISITLKSIVIENAHKELKVTIKHNLGEYTLTLPSIVRWNQGESVEVSFEQEST